MAVDQSLPLREQLEALLAEHASDAIVRERSTFDNFAGPLRDRIVLFGARKLGRKTLKGLLSVGIKPLAFSDNDSDTWGKSIDGVPIYSPREAASRWGSDAVFVITIWGRGSSDTMADRRRKLEALGCRKVLPFVPLFWKFPDTFLPHNALALPHFVCEKAGEIRRTFDVLWDEASRKTLVEQLRWRLTGDFDALSDPVPDEIYFPDFIDRAKFSDTFVDCGAFDGDTVVRFLLRNDYQFGKVFAFEPDPANFKALSRTVSELPAEVRNRIQSMPFAVGAENIKVSFAATGTAGASLGGGNHTVRCIALDDFLLSESPSYIKMDIEGAEPSALLGAKNLIREHRPVIAACSYHLQDHLWSIPLLLSQLNPEYAVVLRQHIQMVEDLVSYAVPPERVDSRRLSVA